MTVFAASDDVVMVLLGQTGTDKTSFIRHLLWHLRWVVLTMGGERLDTRNLTSKLMLTILADVATWEREIMLER